MREDPLRARASVFALWANLPRRQQQHRIVPFPGRVGTIDGVEDLLNLIAGVEQELKRVGYAARIRVLRAHTPTTIDILHGLNDLDLGRGPTLPLSTGCPTLPDVRWARSQRPSGLGRRPGCPRKISRRFAFPDPVTPHDCTLLGCDGILCP